MITPAFRGDVLLILVVVVVVVVLVVVVQRVQVPLFRAGNKSILYMLVCSTFAKFRTI